MCNVILQNWSYANYSVKILKSEYFPTGRFDPAPPSSATGTLVDEKKKQYSISPSWGSEPDTPLTWSFILDHYTTETCMPWWLIKWSLHSIAFFYLWVWIGWMIRNITELTQYSFLLPVHKWNGKKHYGTYTVAFFYLCIGGMVRNITEPIQ
jgi:hypothetical protein